MSDHGLPPDVTGESDRGQHLTRDVLWRFMDSQLSPAEMRHAFRHLLQGCPSCRQQARDVWNLAVPGAAATAPMARMAPMAPIAPRVPLSAPLLAALAPARGPARGPAHDSPNPAVLELVASAGHGGSNAQDAPTTETAEATETTETTEITAEGHDGNRAKDSAYDTVLDRVFSRVTLEEASLDAARRRAGALFEELMHHPPARQLMLVQNSSRFRDPMLCERLLAASHEEGFNDPARSQQLARVAVAVVERVAEQTAPAQPAQPTQLARLTQPTRPTQPTQKVQLAQLVPSAELARGAAAGAATPDLLAGLRARSWAQLGNALRVCSDHEGAAAAFRSAEALLSAHPRLGLVDKAKVLVLRASLHRDQRQFGEAARLLDRVIAIYRRLGQSHLVGQALAQKGYVLLQAHDAESSMVLLRRALELIDPQEDPRLHLIVRHNLILALLDDGKPREAFALLFHTRPLYLKMGDRMNLLRLRWLEGQVAQGLHRLEQAEAAFREVRDAYIELGIEYDAALVSLDLATVYAQQGRTAETRRLAQEMLAFFESRQIHREAMTAFLIFCTAAQAEQAGVDLVREVSAFLKQARHTPDLRFVPSVPRRPLPGS
ncbi:MAG: tetratricopeptide repeat protein [Acidobacteria bacterium]|nr:tetratricopeptide repeat protein [Acidobacteriota bacterium]